MSLYHLVYISEATVPMSADQLKDILVKARANNHALRVTGLLLHSEGRFLQVLEGEQQVVEALYKRIADDGRHRITGYASDSTDQRIFPDWIMGFGELSQDEFAQFIGYVDSSHSAFLLPRAHNAPTKMRTLMQDFVTDPGVLLSAG